MQKYDAHMIAPKLKQLKNERGFTEMEIAKKAGVSYPTVSKLIQGQNINPTIGIMIDIAKVFGVSPVWFIEC
jgi:transcriptional regulator with XRE-family HTH domain